MHRIRYLALLAFIWTQHLFRLAYWKEHFEDVLNRHPPTPESTNLQLAPGRRTSSKDRWHLHVLLILRTCSNKAYSLLFRQTSLAKHFYVLTRARDSVCFSLHWASQILIRKQKAMKRADYNALHLLNWHIGESSCCYIFKCVRFWNKFTSVQNMRLIDIPCVVIARVSEHFMALMSSKVIV